MHAWAEVFLPGAGWVGLDPTSGLLAGEGHIPVACTPEPASAAPLTGFIGEKAECEFEHLMRVDRVWEAPRVTKPYSDEEWLKIENLGHRIDADLEKQDVRLTMGGEPTFVSVDDPDGEEWNTAALGPTKRFKAAELFGRLKEKYAPEGFAHFGQGKWYPGEQLPRWALACFWRRDGQPIAQPSLFADEKKDYGANAEIAQRFLAGIASRLGVTEEFVFPAYEDLFYYMWRERRLPTNVDALDSRVADPMERARLMKVFSQGLSHVVGHVLPLSRSVHGQWQTGPWFLRSELCYLIPGDSPMGYRLPLDSQPWVVDEEYPYIHGVDPTETQPALPSYADIRQQNRADAAANEGIGGAARSAAQEQGRSPRRATMTSYGWDGAYGEQGRDVLDADGQPLGKGEGTTHSARADHRFQPHPDTLPADKQSALWITRTAICAEARKGVLYLFMPPTQTLEDYLAIIAAAEGTSEELGMPVVFEGYAPPSDPRLAHFSVTPDPGVIEVNIHPCHNWDEMVERTTHLYEQAHYSRLTTEKFMIDGRHTGTGGGNHIVMGGATTLDSPFLRRPDVLRSLISYWHNHPSLSYLFSGLFIGPTSQAPRMDEARNDSVYELELAFKQFPEVGATCPPWLVDRLLRNLLIDSSGNTHRAEFCIDKLYSPDGPTGRHGLVELRAFEMPPHARMSLTQQLLLRALVSRFWQQPYQPQRLRRWGTELHDRFMLPHFVRQDFNDVLQELREFGYPFQDGWFDAHFEFRFPRHGEFAVKGVHVELRHALEPWHVMGEEGGAGGTVRYVDSSVERLQVKVTGLNDDRHVMTVNGESIPLQPTGRVGEFVGAVRYRAWQPASCLHPTIGVHAPLVFDLVDSWMERSMGGCQYHVAHPGGRNHETFPINAYEAEGRRLARFFAMGYTPGKIQATIAPRDLNFPFTLDLRKAGK